MSLLADYHKEHGFKNVIESDDGFLTFYFVGQECYIEDLYVVPSKRKSHVASNMAKQVEDIARNQGCKYVTGSVNTHAKDPTTSMKVLLSYGFSLLRAEPHMIWFVKELK